MSHRKSGRLLSAAALLLTVGAALPGTGCRPVSGDTSDEAGEAVTSPALPKPDEKAVKELSGMWAVRGSGDDGGSNEMCLGPDGSLAINISYKNPVPGASGMQTMRREGQWSRSGDVLTFRYTDGGRIEYRISRPEKRILVLTNTMDSTRKFVYERR